jgi:hypothetical protein
MKNIKLFVLAMLCIFAFGAAASVVSAQGVSNVITTDVSGSAVQVIQFAPGQTVYVEYTIKTGVVATMTFTDAANNPIAPSVPGLTGSGELTFTAPMTQGDYYVSVDTTTRTGIAVASFFVVPEAAIGALAALGAGLAAFGVVKLRAKKD